MLWLRDSNFSCKYKSNLKGECTAINPHSRRMDSRGGYRPYGVTQQI